MTSRRAEPTAQAPGPFADRAAAGRALAGPVADVVGSDAVVLGLPRGGVPVAAEVAPAIGAPLDVLVVRKIGAPGQPELAMGAVAGVGGAVEVVRTERVLQQLRVADEVFDRACARETAELDRRQRQLRGAWPAVPVRGRPVVVVDDGLATGSTVRAALAALRAQGPSHVLVAVPVGARATCASLTSPEAGPSRADEVLCLWTPEPFVAVGQGYRDFGQTSDEEVAACLERARRVS